MEMTFNDVTRTEQLDLTECSVYTVLKSISLHSFHIEINVSATAGLAS
jgi:hypothetical protein